MGWKRATKYLGLRIMRLSAASNAVPRGFACGITASFFPVFGVHALLAMAMAFALRANLVAAALGTLVFPPIILPFVFTFDFWVGSEFLKLTGFSFTPALAADGSTPEIGTLQNLESFFIPALTGSILLMSVVWPLSYIAVKKGINLLRHHHHAKKAP